MKLVCAQLNKNIVLFSIFFKVISNTIRNTCETDKANHTTTRNSKYIYKPIDDTRRAFMLLKGLC